MNAMREIINARKFYSEFGSLCTLKNETEKNYVTQGNTMGTILIHR